MKNPRKESSWVRNGFVVSVLLSGALASTASANMRVGRKVDGVFTGSLKAIPSAASIRLLAEDLEAAFPDLDLARLGPRDTLLIKATYEVENRSDQLIALPVRFIAVDIQDLAAELNGRSLTVSIVEAPGEKSECLARIARHRNAFLPVFYQDFLKQIRRLTGLDQEPDDRWLVKLSQIDASGLESASLFPRTIESPPEKDFPAAEFEIPLPPGKSRVVVTYRQRLYIEERNHGYFAVWPKKGVTGFDYLLYPAGSWDLDPGFRIRISVEVPDARGKKFFFKTWERPTIKCNLPLRPQEGRTKNIRMFKGDFAGLPADVLTFLLWVDKAAAAYVR
ncbi:MAG: hypothetical protein NTW38_01345 [Candidatus Aminicenantes bacterium]|nr:hypothetical protein [Candidatus Aminicenantes bacterium]